MSSTSVRSLTKVWVGWDGRTLGAQDKPRTISCIRMVRKIRCLLPLKKPCSQEPGAFPKELGEQIWNWRWSCSLSSFQQFCCTSDTYWYVSSFPALFWNSKLVKNTHYSCHPVFTHLLNNKKETKNFLSKPMSQEHKSTNCCCLSSYCLLVKKFFRKYFFSEISKVSCFWYDYICVISKFIISINSFFLIYFLFFRGTSW